MESGFVLLIEDFTALEEEQVLKLLVRYAGLLRRSNAGAGSILTGVEQ
jgi:hypothetical protein